MQSVRTAVQIVEVEAEENGRKLTTFLQARLGYLPAGLVMRLVRSGQVRIDGRRCKPFDRVSAGQKVRIPPVTVEERVHAAQGRTDLDVVHEDADMLVVNKPSGLPVHAGTGWSDSVHDRLRARFPGQAFTPVPVHRLDRDTSGLLLCAKTHDFLRAMHEVWTGTTKAYLCWVEGIWQARGWMTIVSDLAKAATAGGEKVVSGRGRRAVSHVHPVSAAAGRSLVLVVLGTGRTHQIRVHLADRGHAIVGDPKYGRGGRLMLHATFLSWPGHSYFALPPWSGDFQVSPALAGTVNDIITTAPAKEGAS